MTFEDTIRTILREEIEAALDRRASPEWLTAEEFGERVGRAATTVRTYCRAGKIPDARRLNSRGDYRIPAWAVDRFIETFPRADDAQVRPLHRALERVR